MMYIGFVVLGMFVWELTTSTKQRVWERVNKLTVFTQRKRHRRTHTHTHKEKERRREGLRLDAQREILFSLTDQQTNRQTNTNRKRDKLKDIWSVIMCRWDCQRFLRKQCHATEMKGNQSTKNRRTCM